MVQIFTKISNRLGRASFFKMAKSTKTVFYELAVDQLNRLTASPNPL